MIAAVYLKLVVKASFFSKPTWATTNRPNSTHLFAHWVISLAIFGMMFWTLFHVRYLRRKVFSPTKDICKISQSLAILALDYPLIVLLHLSHWVESKLFLSIACIHVCRFINLRDSPLSNRASISSDVSPEITTILITFSLHHYHQELLWSFVGDIISNFHFCCSMLLIVYPLGWRNNTKTLLWLQTQYLFQGWWIDFQHHY